MKRLRLRGTMPTINPLQTQPHVVQRNRTAVPAQPCNVIEQTSPFSGLTHVPEETSHEEPDELAHISAQDDMVSTSHLRSRPLSLDNFLVAQLPVSSLSRPMTRENYTSTPQDLLDNFNRLGLKSPPVASDDDADYWWTQSQQLITRPISAPLRLHTEETNATNARRRVIRSLKYSALRAEHRGKLSRSAEIWYRYHMKQHRFNQKRVEQRIEIDEHDTTLL